MKECMNVEKHGTCQSKAWNANMTKRLCSFCVTNCLYRRDFIHFKDIKEDTIMYSGDIESTHEFKTKAEWIKEFGHDDFRAESNEIWHTASIRVAEIDITSILEDIEESSEMYDGWYFDILPCKDDPIIKAGIERLNEIFRNHPTYVEDQKVMFD